MSWSVHRLSSNDSDSETSLLNKVTTETVHIIIIITTVCEDDAVMFKT